MGKITINSSQSFAYETTDELNLFQETEHIFLCSLLGDLRNQGTSIDPVPPEYSSFSTRRAKHNADTT